MKRLFSVILIFVLVLSCVACNNTNSSNSVQPVYNNNANNNQAQQEADEQARREAEEKARREAEEKARREAEEKAIKEAQVVVEGFLDEFCVLNLKGMAEYTDADIDYSEMEYLSLDEYKQEMLNEFRVFTAMGLPLDGFMDIIDTVFASYEKYSSYKILNAQVQDEKVVFDVRVEYIKAETMEDIINRAINKIDMEALEMKAAGALIVGGLTSGSVKGAIEAVMQPVIDTLDLAVSRSIEELKPEKETVKFVVSEIDGEWVIRDQLSDYSGLSKIFERTTTN